MIKAGITGGIGSGKSTIARIFSVLGIPVFYADTAAKKVITDDIEVVQAMRQNFGNEAYLSDGQLNRSYIASKVFNDQKQLEILNGIVHPATFRAMDSWVKEQKNVPYVLKEAALLYESGSYKQCDCTILVLADEKLKVERIKQRDGITEEQIKARMSRQMSDDEKKPMADFIIINNGRELLIPQVLHIHKQILAGEMHG